MLISRISIVMLSLTLLISCGNGKVDNGSEDNGSAQVIDEPENSIDTPTVISNNAVSLSAGLSCTFGLNNYGNGMVWALGYGPLGLGEGFLNTQCDSPVRVVGLTEVERTLDTNGKDIIKPKSWVTEISAGGSHVVALKDDKTVWCWGENIWGALGDGTRNDHAIPVQVTGLSDDTEMTKVIQIAASKSPRGYTVVLKKDGTVWAWGRNFSGELGLDPINTLWSLTPVGVAGISDVTSVAAGDKHNVALKSDGTVWTWGDNSFGQLGDETATNRYTPAQVSGITDVTAITAGYSYTAALKSDGTVWVWGKNVRLDQADVGKIKTNTPMKVDGLASVVALAAGDNHTVALKSDGTAWAWGCNDFGQLGDGTTTNRYTPVQVKEISGVPPLTAGGKPTIAVGAKHTVVSDINGVIWGWGCNSSGQLEGIYPDDFIFIGIPYENRLIPRKINAINPMIALNINVIEGSGSGGFIHLSPASENNNPIYYYNRYNVDEHRLAFFQPETKVVLTPHKRWESSVFTSWTGCDSVDGDHCIVTISLEGKQDKMIEGIITKAIPYGKSISAQFDLKQ